MPRTLPEFSRRWGRTRHKSFNLSLKRPTPAQQRVIQRADGDDFSGSRTAGIVTSKGVQGIFTTVLGPVGLVWRGPLIQKNLGEIWGKNIASRPGKVDDRKRYGETHFGTAMRWLASISELLKEFTIWLGFGTFIAAIVAAATHGVAAPVFAGLAIATAVTAGLHFVLRELLVLLNGYRLYRKRKEAGGADQRRRLRLRRLSRSSSIRWFLTEWKDSAQP